MQHLTRISDLNTDHIKKIIDLGFAYKHKFDLGIRKENILNGKMIAMVFEKPSLRTKVAFEIATEYLGGTAVYLSTSQILASGNNERGRESIPDIARNLERFSDLILARVYSHSTIDSIVKHVRKPVINALCDLHHPTQALADLMTIRWKKPDQKSIKVAYIGDGNNVAASLMEICAVSRIQFVHAGPKGFEIPEASIDFARQAAKDQGGPAPEFTEDPFVAARGADVIYTDTFVSMGQEEEKAKRLEIFSEYQVCPKLFQAARPDSIFMHCLPAHRGEEVTDDIMDHERSVVFDQAECRMHIAKALISYLLA